MERPPEPTPGATPGGPAPGAPNTLADAVEPNRLSASHGFATSADPGAAPPDTSDAPAPDPPDADSAPADPSTGASTVPSWGVPAGAPPRRAVSRGRIAFLGVFGAVAVIVVKYGIGFFVAGAVIGVAGSLFGSQWDRLPSDVKSGYEARLNAAVGSRFDGQSDADSSAGLQRMVMSGLARLDDQRLQRRLQLESTAMDALDAATCGRVAHALLASAHPTRADAEAMIGALDGPSFQAWAGINVDAVEAEAAGTPARRTVSDGAVNGASRQVIARLTDSQASTLTAASNGEPISDAAACDLTRAYYRAGVNAGGSTFATLALLDVASP